MSIDIYKYASVLSASSAALNRPNSYISAVLMIAKWCFRLPTICMNQHWSSLALIHVMINSGRHILK